MKVSINDRKRSVCVQVVMIRPAAVSIMRRLLKTRTFHHFLVNKFPTFPETTLSPTFSLPMMRSPLPPQAETPLPRRGFSWCSRFRCDSFRPKRVLRCARDDKRRFNAVCALSRRFPINFLTTSFLLSHHGKAQVLYIGHTHS